LMEVRYQEHGDNRLLRHVLCLVWGQQCHWCRLFKDFLDLQIDHILPKTSGEGERLRLKQMFGLPDDYDVHAPYNLAPICGECNRTKSNDDLTETGLVLPTLRKASRLAPRATRQVVAFGNPSKLAGALLEAAVADLSNTGTRETFEQFAPAVVQRLAELGEGKTDFFVFRTEEVEVGDELQRIGLRLNERGRGAVVVLDSVAGGRLEEALSAPPRASA
jgi:5-methylcytosine-specific restriction endonuclease McrA